IVLNNRDLNMVTWEQRILAGEPKFEASQDIPDIPYASFAQLLGLKGIRVENPEDINQALRSALHADRPTILDILVDPNVPITPSHISMETMHKFSKALLKGDPEQSGIIRQTIKEIMQGGMA
ncbi:MAG TPA: thiamine pyrophosphate-dependent enzyme, partial [Cytophagales bacterium]|nr:thiamine pyrophosphate-dependent enzyme [Cytophagales bacterium]